MRRSLPPLISTLLAGVGFLCAQTASGNRPLSNNDVIQMSRGGVPVSTIIAAIQSGPADFDVSPAGLVALHAAGVGEEVLNQMIGACSLPMKLPASFGVATATFPANDAAGRMVRYSGWIRTENVQNGYAGLWWRVDGAEQGKVLLFDNSAGQIVDGQPAKSNGVIRGAKGTTGWTRYELELPVPAEAFNINFGLLLTGTGNAWFDALRIEVNGSPWANPQFDFDFESPTPKGFPFAGDNLRTNAYKVGIDNTTAFTGRQSLKMQFTGDRNMPEPPAGPARPIGIQLSPLDPATVDDGSRSVDHATPVPINFVNRSSTAVDIYWIDYEGRRVLYRTGLSPGASWLAGTYLTHPWLVVVAGTCGTTRKDTGVRLAGFEASSASGGDAVITDRR